VVLGGGSLLQDGTSSRSFWYYAALLFLSHRMGKKPVVYAGGIGPLRRPLHRAVTVWLLRRAAAISLRDEQSAAWLTERGIPAERLQCGADPALQEKPPRGVRACGGDGAVRLVIAPGSAARWTRRQQAALVAALVDFAQKRRVTVCLAALFPRQDLPLCRALQKRLARAGRGLACRGRVADSLPRAAALAREADLVLSARLHLLLPAACCGVPLLALGDDPKTAAFVRSVGLWDPPRDASGGPLPDGLSHLLTAFAAHPLPLQSRLRARIPALADLARATDKHFVEAIKGRRGEAT
jgi:polysaccharide pyruvyl transferase CsaB